MARRSKEDIARICSICASPNGCGCEVWGYVLSRQYDIQYLKTQFSTSFGATSSDLKVDISKVIQSQTSVIEETMPEPKKDDETLPSRDLLRIEGDDGEMEPTQQLPETVLFTKVLDLFEIKRVNSIQEFLKKLDEIISYAQTNQCDITLYALKSRHDFTYVRNQSTEVVIAASEKVQIKDFVQLRADIAKEWNALQPFLRSKEALPIVNMKKIIRMSLDKIQAHHRVTPFHPEELTRNGPSVMTLRQRLEQILFHEFWPADEEDR